MTLQTYLVAAVSLLVAIAGLFLAGCYFLADLVAPPPTPTIVPRPMLAAEAQPLPALEAEQQVEEMVEETLVDFTFPVDALGKSLESEVTPPRGITGPPVPAVAAPQPWSRPPAETRFALPARSWTPLEWKYEGRSLPQERGWVKSATPAFDQPPLGLAAEPPRPALPGFATGPLVKGPEMPSPAAPASEPRLGDVKPQPTDAPPLAVGFTTRFPLVQDAGLKPPPAERIKVPDPQEFIEAVQLRQPLADAEPPAFVPAAPSERLVLPVAPPPPAAAGM